MPIAAVIMAAGASVRLGQPKQLLVFEGETLLAHAIGAAREAECSPIIVVVGANGDAVVERHRGAPVEFVSNADWAQGLGTSIRVGVSRASSAEAILLMTCDQPRVTAASLQRLIAAHRETAAQIAAASYANTVGVPALFTRERFPDLLALEPEHGAKQVILAHEDVLVRVPLPEAAEDIDTPAQLAQLRNEHDGLHQSW